MRACIIAANNIRYSPYIFFYTDILEKINIHYDIIFPDRNNIEEINDSNIHKLSWNNKYPTIVNYIKYSYNIKKILKKEEYNILIVLTGINAAFLGLWLKKHYNKKYIIDIRDYSHENIKCYYMLEKIAIDNSMLNIISSRRFMEFLPKSDYHVCHNYSGYDNTKEEFKKGQEPIRIGYIGGLSYVDQCTKLMKLIAADSRFIFEFYGTSDMEAALKEEAKTFQCDRIIFHGSYAPQDKTRIIKQVDILFNAYGNGCPLLDCALSNKLYDALIFKKPILTCADTYMTEMAGPLAFPIDLTKENALNDLYDWYQKIDGNIVCEYSNTTMEKIKQENNETKSIIAVSIENIK